MSLNDTDVAIVEKAVQETLEHLEKYAPEEYAKLNADPEKKKAVTEAARNAATEHVKLAKEFANQPDDIAERLAKHLPENRIMMLRNGLEFPTFRMNITKKDDGKYWAALTRDEKELEPVRALMGSDDIDWGEHKNWASILVDAVMVAMSVVGIHVPPDDNATMRAVEETVQAIRSCGSALRKVKNAFVEAWNRAGNARQKARAVFFLIKDSNIAGHVWTIIKTFFSKMPWYNWCLKFVRVIGMIKTAIATDGAALISLINVGVLNAVDFKGKIDNLNQLEAIKSAMYTE